MVVNLIVRWLVWMCLLFVVGLSRLVDFSCVFLLIVVTLLTALCLDCFVFSLLWLCFFFGFDLHCMISCYANVCRLLFCLLLLDMVFVLSWCLFGTLGCTLGWIVWLRVVLCLLHVVVVCFNLVNLLGWCLLFAC